MKLVVLFILVSLFQVQAREGYAQTVNLTRKNVSIVEVFREIKKQTNYNIISKSRIINGIPLVSVEMDNMLLKDALNQLLVPVGLSYIIEDNSIVIKKAIEVWKHEATANKSRLQQKQVAGKITDEEGEPLIGVSIRVKGESEGTSTNAFGQYLIQVEEGETLIFSYVGFVSQEKKYIGQTNLDVILKPDMVDMDEVVVVGYGTQRRSDLTGSIATVKTSDIQQTPISSIDQGLVGRASGVLVTQTSGMPGAAASIRIRGASSLQGGNEPLYVIDGVPVYSGGGFGETGGSTRMSALSTINPSDIESLEILKDASATAIYGSRAANGVILITTKSGKSGHDQISFDAYYGVQSIVKKIDVLDGTSYARLVNEAYINDGLKAPYTEEFISKIYNGGKGTNWQNEIFNSAPMQNYQLSFSGGDPKSTYAVSLNYLDQEGIVLNSDLKRYSGRVNLSRKMNEKFKVASHLTMSRNISNMVETDVGGEGGVITGALKFNPILPVYQDKDLGIYTQVNVPGSLYPNPVATALEMKRMNNTTRLLSDISGELEILEDLKVKVLFAVDYFMNKAQRYTPSNIYQSGGVASASISDAMYTNWLNENTLSYSKKLNENHSFNVLGGITFQQNKEQGLSASSQGFVNNVLKDNNLGSGSIYNKPGSSATEWDIMSFLGRLNYTFKDKYLFTASGRYDGSSRFGTNNKFAFFPSAAVAWKLGEESFISDLNVFSNLKMRLGYGVTGNQEIGLYSSLPTLTSVNYTFGQKLSTGFYPNIIPNPDLKWERTSQYDFGVDMSILNNRVSLTADLYYKKTTDLIYNVSIPFVSGFGTSLQNIGSLENKGAEFALETRNIDNEFRWSTSFNISFNKNRILRLGGEQYKEIGEGDGHLKTGSVHRLIVNEPIGLFYGYVFDGVFQNQGELDEGPKGFTNYIGGKRYKDLSGPNGTPDGSVDATYDRTIVGDPNPDYYGGMGNTFSYKNFELNTFLLYSHGNDILNYNAIELGLPTGGQNVYQELANRWTPENPNNTFSKATTNRSAVFSDQFIEDGSYLKLKTVTLSYSFSNLKLRNLSGLRVYITGQNLLTWTKYKGYDPEVSYRGASNLEIGEDYGGYPQARSFMVGLSIGLK